MADLLAPLRRTDHAAPQRRRVVLQSEPGADERLRANQFGLLRHPWVSFNPSRDAALSRGRAVARQGLAFSKRDITDSGVGWALRRLWCTPVFARLGMSSSMPCRVRQAPASRPRPGVGSSEAGLLCRARCGSDVGRGNGRHILRSAQLLFRKCDSRAPDNIGLCNSLARIVHGHGRACVCPCAFIRSRLMELPVHTCTHPAMTRGIGLP